LTSMRVVCKLRLAVPNPFESEVTPSNENYSFLKIRIKIIQKKKPALAVSSNP
jgi:hypothetical protein